MKFIFLLIIAIIANHGYSEISKIQSFREADFSGLTSESLVIFDVDEVLITPQDALMGPAGWSYQSALWTFLRDGKHDNLMSIVFTSTKYILVDATAPKLIAELIRQGIPTMALTGARTGSMGLISSFENWRLEQLAQLGIHFNFIYEDECRFSHLVDEKVNPPIYKEGILFCGEFFSIHKKAKGHLLGVFLDHIGFRPDRVVFFDDQMNNLVVVEEELNNRGIPYQGYYFQGESVTHLDPEIAEIQLQILFENEKWLSDQEAKTLRVLK